MRVRTIAVAVGAAVVGVVVLVSLTRSTSGGVEFSGDLRAGGELESLSLPRLAGEGSIDYAGLDDRPLVINFFASWCPNCIAEMPDFERVHVSLGDRVEFLGISQSDAEQASIDLVHETGITYDAGIDRDGAFFTGLGVVGMPTTVFVRPGGEIAEVWQGGLDATTLEQLIGEHLGVTG
ncbi:MAG: TlpA family protein disulfide reductase [Actinomycetota bacterium]|nr:TlpA family protein disulfide reductase [Actinomycetota bacterium]MDH5225055.1 TlpA family protein disulfide reductase [Actinomycetota bacterium]MDH5314455.1 TlpA family protein disulfide reductase [Actinomycetota bacterium]